MAEAVIYFECEECIDIMKNLFYLSVLIGILTVNIAIYPNMAAMAVSNEKNVSASDVRQRQGQQIDNKRAC